MSCYGEVVRIGKKLEKMIVNKTLNDSVALDLLNELKRQPMTLEVLQKSRIGMSVNNYRKLSKHEPTVTLAKSLIKSWKKLLDDNASPSSQSLSSKKQPSSSATTAHSNRSPADPRDSPLTTGGSLGGQPSPKSDSSSRGSDEAVLTGGVGGAPATVGSAGGAGGGQGKAAPTADAVRLKCRQMIAEALRSGESFEGAADVDRLAANLEDCVFMEFKNTDAKYKNRIRSRIINLKPPAGRGTKNWLAGQHSLGKLSEATTEGEAVLCRLSCTEPDCIDRDPKNPRLRENVLLGRVTVERLARMSADEMASDAMRTLRAQFTKEAIDDHHLATMSGTKSDLFKCGKCGERDTMYNQVQTRSADEPMTTFVLCNNCGNRWKFC